MQSLKSLLRNPIMWGAAALVVTTAVAMVVAMLYVSPPNKTSLTFYTDDAASIRPGDDVRIAGITVGEIKSLALDSNRIRVTARIDRDVFVGDKSQIQVRMLTVVGGYYVNLVSLGREPLGDAPIPLERVVMPYSLVRTLTDATKVSDEVDPKPIRESLDQISRGLEGSNADSLTAIIDAGNALMSIVERQRGQVTKILDLSDEYLRSLNAAKGTLTELVRKVAILQQTLELYGKNFRIAIKGMGDILMAIYPVGVFYDNHRDDFLEKARNFLQKGQMWVDRNGLTVRILKRIQNRVERVLDAQNAPPELLATDMCVPVPGVPC
ncbi:MCE family protein [Mycolicibacterium pulveris]|uniref:Mce/MlaD domain-containing protein n=1 Tax=Mycolicibacterium pulveris TaxID=36813 RepID=A0A7I7URK2_MYCPV|nr:MlaD family protein [Mycolicibacterium pulveris]MCV6983542.1 MCE family protein [Mycolicibacterium pulveris]BBY83421.1 hypothetical protein MPUL_45790 [Mycolicibacterium pulveris]